VLGTFLYAAEGIRRKDTALDIAYDPPPAPDAHELTLLGRRLENSAIRSGDWTSRTHDWDPQKTGHRPLIPTVVSLPQQVFKQGTEVSGPRQQQCSSF
jgi:hypothetical protein